MREIEIAQKEANQRFDKFLLKYLNNASKSFVYKMLRKKNIKLNGRVAEGSEILQSQDKIQIYFSEDTIQKFKEEKVLTAATKKFDVIYEDDNIAVVNKRAGTLSHPESSDDKDTLSQQFLFYLYEKKEYDPNETAGFIPAISNRLDRNTSGIIVCGKNLAAVQALNRAFAENAIRRIYTVLLKGCTAKTGKISGFIRKDKNVNKSQMLKYSRPNENLDQALTYYQTIMSNDSYSLVEAELKTGKSHQIRAGFQAAGYAVVGDRKYGESFTNEFFRKKYGLNNQFLHASKIVFSNLDEPLSYLNGKEFVSQLPGNLQKIIDNILL